MIYSDIFTFVMDEYNLITLHNLIILTSISKEYFNKYVLLNYKML